MHWNIYCRNIFDVGIFQYKLIECLLFFLFCWRLMETTKLIFVLFLHIVYRCRATHTLYLSQHTVFTHIFSTNHLKLNKCFYSIIYTRVWIQKRLQKRTEILLIFEFGEKHVVIHCIFESRVVFKTIFLNCVDRTTVKMSFFENARIRCVVHRFEYLTNIKTDRLCYSFVFIVKNWW